MTKFYANKILFPTFPSMLILSQNWSKLVISETPLAFTQAALLSLHLAHLTMTSALRDRTTMYHRACQDYSSTYPTVGFNMVQRVGVGVSWAQAWYKDSCDAVRWLKMNHSAGLLRSEVLIGSCFTFRISCISSGCTRTGTTAGSRASLSGTSSASSPTWLPSRSEPSTPRKVRPSH